MLDVRNEQWKLNVSLITQRYLHNFESEQHFILEADGFRANPVTIGTDPVQLFSTANTVRTVQDGSRSFECRHRILDGNCQVNSKCMITVCILRTLLRVSMCYVICGWAPDVHVVRDTLLVNGDSLQVKTRTFRV